MRVESAEMTKHALNGFLATSVAFINEVAAICESVGADAEEVSRGLKSERRIGPRAYLVPAMRSPAVRSPATSASCAVWPSATACPPTCSRAWPTGNAAHKHWTRRKLLELLAADIPSGAPSPGGTWRSGG